MRSVVLSSLFAVSATLLVAADLEVRLDPPPDNAKVPWRACFTGQVTDPAASVYILVHPFLAGDYWVQPIPYVRPDGSFKVLLYFGAGPSVRYEGEHFEVTAIANPQTRLAEGQTVPGLPEAQARSQTIEVVRDAGAASGCSLLEGSEPAVAQEPPRSDDSRAFSEHDRTVAPSPPQVASRRGENLGRSGNRVTALTTVGLWGSSALALLSFAACVLLPTRRQALEVKLARWNVAIGEKLRGLWVWICSRVVALYEHSAERLPPRVMTVWRKTGCAGDLKVLARALILTLLLALLVWFGLIAESLGNLAGLEMVFNVEAAASPIPHIIDDFGSALAADSDSADSGDTWWIRPMRAVWNAPLGPVAIGLAAIQALFGVVLFSGTSQHQAAGKSLFRLVRDRPLLGTCFLVLNSAVAVLAAYRAYELSPPEIPWILPAAVAGVIGAVVPWVQAYSLHYLVEAAEVVASVTAFATAVAALVLWAVLLHIAALFTSIAVLSAVAAWFVLAWAVTLILSFALLIAELLGELLDLTLTAWRSRPQGIRASADAHLLGLIILLGLTPLALRAEPPIAHDAGKPYQAWILIIDVSTSVAPEQFANAQRALVDTVTSQVKANDLVWLIRAGEQHYSSAPFPIPPMSRRRSQTAAGAQSINAAKAILVRRIQNLGQVDTDTNLGDPIELAMDLFHAHKVARKRLRIYSDFISDLKRQHPTPYPGDLSSSVSANQVEVGLILTHPKPGYATSLATSQGQLFEIVEDHWRHFFLRMGAASVSVTLVDAIPPRSATKP